MSLHSIRSIISGGQTGADRGGLDFALAHKIPCGGWCPKGRMAEDGVIPVHYPLKETGSASYPSRTRRNIASSDGTLVFSLDEKVDRGTQLTITLCEKLNKPCLQVHLNISFQNNISLIRSWLGEQKIITLNIAGCRESVAQGIQVATKVMLEKVFIPL